MATERKSRIAMIEEKEAAIAAHAKGKPLVGNLLMPDPTPIAPPIGYRKQPSMVDIIRDQIRQAGLDAQRAGGESFEEFYDFDVPDEQDFISTHEVETETPLSVLRDRAREAALAERAAKAPIITPPSDPSHSPSPPAEREGEKGEGSQNDPPPPPPAR